MVRLIAIIILFFPGALAVYGIKIMRDTLFGVLNPIFFQLWIQFTAGLVFFGIGLWFIGGFILHRDRKRKKTKGRFKNSN